MTQEIARLIYMEIHRSHDEWRERYGHRYNNAIIVLLRNRLKSDVKQWLETHISRRLPEIPEHLKQERNILADISYRRFHGELDSTPCEICGFSKAPNVAHIIPRALGGPDDDWNLVHLCANHHYLFDAGLLTEKEYRSIPWQEKGGEARHFADRVRLRQHQRSWQNEQEAT